MQPALSVGDRITATIMSLTLDGTVVDLTPRGPRVQFDHYLSPMLVLPAEIVNINGQPVAQEAHA
jgi:hypothetical protein